MRQLPEVMQTEALIGWNDLRPDDPTTVAKIRDVAGRLTTETVIYVVSALNLMLGAVRGPVPSTKREQQIGLAQDLLPRSLVNQVVVRLANGTIDRVFHTEQLLLAARIAIEFGQQGAFQAVDREFVGELLLRTNDCLMSRPGRTRDDIVAMALRQLGASRTSKSVTFSLGITISWSREPALARSPMHLTRRSRRSLAV